MVFDRSIFYPLHIFSSFHQQVCNRICIHNWQPNCTNNWYKLLYHFWGFQEEDIVQLLQLFYL